MKHLLCALSMAIAAPAALATTGDDTRQWNFRVLLDGSEIGYHRFRLRDTGGQRLLESEARFDVGFLFFTAFSYRHDDTEKWRDGCLVELNAKTVTNGDEQVVSGTRRGDAFVVHRSGETETLPGCVMTFAYWNPRILEQSRLLNPQTGEYLPVDVRELSPDELDVGGRTLQARRYRLEAPGIELELWYSPDDRWLALESTAKGGRKLRYVPG